MGRPCRKANNLFADPNAVAAQSQPLLPGPDTNAGGNGVLRGSLGGTST